MSWNGYSSYSRNSIIKRLRNDANTNRNEEINNEKKMIWVRLPYLGQVGDEMKKLRFIKVQKYLTQKLCFFIRYETRKLTIFCSSNNSESQMLFIA